MFEEWVLAYSKVVSGQPASSPETVGQRSCFLNRLEQPSYCPGCTAWGEIIDKGAEWREMGAESVDLLSTGTQTPIKQR